MTTISNSDLPGFDSDNFRAFMSCIQRDWNLPTKYQSAADFYFLRHWTAAQICDNLTADGITIDGITYFPLFKRDSQIAYNKELNLFKQPGQEPKLFWLSFRAVRYPLGSGSQHPWALKAYVLIQEDTRTKGN